MKAFFAHGLGSLLATAILACPAPAQETWVGETVMCRKPNMKLSGGPSGKQLVDMTWREYRVLEVADWTEAIRLDPKAVDAYVNRGILWDTEGQDLKAVADMDKAIELDPRATKAYLVRGMTWHRTKQHDKAIADFTEAVRLDPSNVDSHLLCAMLWATNPDAKIRDGERALEAAKKAIELDAKNALCKVALAAAYAELGNFDEAVRWQEQALEDPQFRNNEGFRRCLELYRNKMPCREQ